MADQNPAQRESQSEAFHDFTAPRWEFFCDDRSCAFDTYGDESIHQLALEHVRETGHTVSMSRKETGKLRLGGAVMARAHALRAENERLRAFAFGDAPEWEKANATLKHRVRELEAEIGSMVPCDDAAMERALDAAMTAIVESNDVILDGEEPADGWALKLAQRAIAAGFKAAGETP